MLKTFDTREPATGYLADAENVSARLCCIM